MSEAYSTSQERFWAGTFGSDYIQRNKGDSLLASNLAFFARALRTCHRLNTCIEFGANIGMNLKALKLLYPDQEQYGVEINADAASELRRCIPPEHVYHDSILNFRPTRKWDVVLTKGVLIHINPDELAKVYDVLTAACGRYLLLAEYYNPVPVAVPYRGHSDRLFKRDFAGEIIDRHSGFALLDYGFVYRRDPAYPQDDITWFLLEARR